MTGKKKKVTLLNEQFYLYGWKDLSRYTGFSKRCLQKWHYERVNCPFIKIHPWHLRSKWVISIDRVHSWFLLLNKSIKPS